MSRLLIVLAILTSACGSPDNPAANPFERRHLAAIETSIPPSDVPDAAPQRIEERLQHWRVPAISVAVFGDGRTKWAKAWGVTDVTTGEPATPRTRFQAGSISKPVTATLILQLVDEQRIDVHGDINSVLRSWKVPSHPWSSVAPVTPAALISHTAGLTVRSFPGYAPGATIPSTLEVLNGITPANTPPVRVTATPGTAYAYSGGGYVVLQQAVTDVVGVPFEVVARQRVFEPLGMMSSSFRAISALGEPDIATGHTAAGERVGGGHHIYPESAAAGLWTTASDLARFAMGIQRALGARAGEPTIVSPGSAHWMISVNPLSGQGMAFSLEPGTFYHAGDTEGYYAVIMASIDGRKGLAIMTNGAQGGHLINEVFRAVVAEYEW